MQRANWVPAKDENGQDKFTWNGYEIRNAGYPADAPYGSINQPPVVAVSLAAFYKGQRLDTGPRHILELMAYCEHHSAQADADLH